MKSCFEYNYIVSCLKYIFVLVNKSYIKHPLNQLIYYYEMLSRKKHKNKAF